MFVLSPSRSAQVYYRVHEHTPVSSEPSTEDIVRENDASASNAR